MDEEERTSQTSSGALAVADEDGALEDARHLRTREKILAAATRTLNSNLRASLADIARDADVGRTTLHRFFPTRAALMAAILERALNRLDAVFERVDFEQSLADALVQLVTECLPVGPEMVLIGNNPEIWEGDWGGRYERYASILANAIERAQARGEARASVPSWWAAQLVMLNLWGGWYVVSEGYIGSRALPELIMDTLLYGLAGEDSPSPR
jgi:TetR/AcrR family transcriptional regulator, repressor for lfrA